MSARMASVRLGRRERFYVAFAATLFFGILWPFALWLPMRGHGSAWWSWFKNDLVHSFFHIVLLPPVVGLIAATSLAAPLRSMGRAGARAGLGVLLVMVALALPPVLDNMHARPLAPFTLDTPAHRFDAYRLDRCLRDWLARPSEPHPCATATDAGVQAVLAAHSSDTIETARREAAFTAYANATASWYDSTKVSQRTVAHWVTFILSFGGTVVAIVVMWLLLLLGYQRKAVDEHSKQRIVLAFLLFVLYLPLAVYVDWYQHYYLFSHLKESSVKVGAFVLAAVAFVMVLVVLGDPKKVLPWVAGLGVLGPLGVALKYPAVLNDVADAVEIMPASLVVGLITLLSLVVVALSDIYVREKAAAERG